MKKGIFTLAFLFLTGSLFAQDTLVASNAGLSTLIGTSAIAKVRTNPPTSTFNIATNGSWDLTNLNYDSSYNLVRSASPVSGFSFADTLKRMFINKFTYDGLEINLAVIQDVAVWKQAIDPQLFLVQKPGGTSDTVLLPTQVASYSTPEYRLRFPLTYHSSINSNYSYAVVFDISDSELAIKKEPATIYTTVNETDSVLGWGKMRVNRMDSVNGTPVKSAWVNVLQVRLRSAQVDSYAITFHPNLYDSLGFATSITYDTILSLPHPANTDSIPTLDTIPNISTVIVINGNDTTVTYDTTYTYDTTGYIYFTSTKAYHKSQYTNIYKELFYRAGSITPVTTVTYTDATFSTIKKVEINTDVSQFDEAVETVPNMYAISVYPNPVTNGKIYIDIAEPGTGNWSYELVNMMGQSITTNAIPTNGTSVHQLANLPTNLPRGIYYMRIKNNNRQVLVKSLNLAN